MDISVSMRIYETILNNTNNLQMSNSEKSVEEKFLLFRVVDSQQI